MDEVWKVAKGLLGTVAPTIATALGGPLAGVATKAIIGALGLADGTPADQVAMAVQNATPEQLLALKKADQDFAVRMRELDIDVLKIEAGDRDSARRRQVDTGDKFPNRLAVAIVVGFFTALAAQYGMTIGFAVFKITVMPELLRVLDTSFGALMGSFATIQTFYYGSNRHSRDKDETIKNLSK